MPNAARHILVIVKSAYIEESVSDTYSSRPLLHDT